MLDTKKDVKIVICKTCGQPFTVIRTDCGAFSRRTTCDACLSASKNQTKTLTCQKCGKTFEVTRTPSGNFSQKKFCPDCDVSQKAEKDVVCQSCGKIFKLGRGSNGAFLKRKFCDECFKQKYQADYILKICNVCGTEFKIYRDEKGYFNKNKVRCDACAQKQDNQPYKTLICQKCGKTFKVGRASNGNFLDHRKYCDECNKPLQQKTYICQICGKNIIKTKENCSNIYSVVKYCKDCATKLGNKKRKETMIARYGVDSVLLLKSVMEANGNTVSKINQSFGKFLTDNNIKYQYEYLVGSKYRYDFYIENTNILLEVNPSFTHTVAGTCLNSYKYNDKFEIYHLDKVLYAQQHDYRCIHIWQWDDWLDILNIIRQDKQKLYARTLSISEIDKSVANKFLDFNHLQGSCYGNFVNLGLYDKNNKLVQVMTFGRPRYNINYEYELLRLCTCAENIIVGGAEKLFKYFIKQYTPVSVISYCDVSKFVGDVYKRLGFKLKEQTKPQKVWSRDVNYSKEYITDNLLRQRGFDQLVGSKLNPPEIYGKGTNNEELMLKHHWLPVYDCGQKVFVWSGQNL